MFVTGAFMQSDAKSTIALSSFDAVIGFNKMPGLDLYYGADFCYLGRKPCPSTGRCTGSRHAITTCTPFEKAVFGRDSQTQILSLSEREKKRLPAVLWHP